MKTYILVAVEETHSQMNGVTLYRIHWVDPRTGETYETTTDSSYRNHPKWGHIVGERQTGYYSGLKRTSRKTREGTPVISADSRPLLQQALTAEETREILMELISPPKNTFKQVFTTGE